MKHTILIVDDESYGRETLEALLTQEDYQLVSAASGREALEKAVTHPPDIVLLDVMMPKMDGFEVCARLRADTRLAEVPVLLLTALDDRGSRLRGLAAGADDFITKPFDRVELRTRLRSLLRLNRYRRLLEAREQLLRAQRLETIGLLAGGVAHDLNNILAPVLLAAQFIEQCATDATIRETARTIRSSAERGAGVVKQVLSFARDCSGTHAKSCPRQSVREMADFIRSVVSKSISVVEQVDANVPDVAVDPTQLYQVLLNLCVNARDAMPDGGTLTLRAANFSLGPDNEAGDLPLKRGDYVHFSVTDTGTGIPADVLPHIFEPLFTTKALDKGTGLGLATVARILREHGGQVTVSSAAGQGTAFHIYLPVATAPPTEPAAADALSAPAGQGELILMVDDDASVREMARASLESCNYRVITAADGIEALLLYGHQRADIAAVVLDLGLPYRDG